MESLFSILRLYAEVNVLLGIAFLFGALLIRSSLSASEKLRLSKFSFLLALVLPFLFWALKIPSFFHPNFELWSGMKEYATTPLFIAHVTSQTAAQLPSQVSGVAVNLGLFRFVALAIFSFSLLLLLNYVRKLFQLYRALKGSLLFRKTGKLRLVVSRAATIPYSATLLNWAYVVLPESWLALSSEEISIALHHEIQHHRQRDTRWVHLFEVAHAFLFLNPILYLWEKLFSELSEFACDEVVIGRWRHSPQAYGSCLLRAAQSAEAPSDTLAGTASMAKGASALLLKRRVEMLFQIKKQNPLERKAGRGLALAAFGLLFSAALWANGVVSDHTLTLAQATKLVDGLRDGGVEIPITMNAIVLDRLNHFLSTSDSRQKVKDALARRDQYLNFVDGMAEKYEAPKELDIVPLVETGYQNKFFQGQHGQGLWGFIVSTARQYRLIVNETVDERFDVNKETDAAFRLLRDDFVRFQDWRLALKAYNEGEFKVQREIDTWGTRDPWTLEEKAPSQEHYLGNFMALLILSRNPQLLD